MEVIKKGNSEKAWTKKVTCTGQGNGNHGCKATLKITMGDLFTTHSSHYDGSNESYVTFRCCECGQLNDVASTWDPTLDRKGGVPWADVPYPDYVVQGSRDRWASRNLT